MNRPSVSILVPVYNGEPFLRECLDSILDQDCADTEILLADDNSTDGSMALLKDYAAKDPRIRWWQNSHNLGLVENWNCLLQAARGEYIKFVFQDDKLLSPTVVSQMAHALTDHSDVALVASATYVIDESSLILEARNYFKPGVSDGRQIVVRCLVQNANLVGEPSVVMFRRSAAGAGFDTQYRQIVDLEFFFRLLERGDFCYISKELAAFRRHPNQETIKNHRNGVGAKEHLLLAKKWVAKPWINPHTSREIYFNQIRGYRKSSSPETLALQAEMMRQLGRRWFWAYWLKRKFTSPFIKLTRQLRMSERCRRSYASE